MHVSAKISAEVIFVDEKPSESTLQNYQDDWDINNHCNHLDEFNLNTPRTKNNSTIQTSDLYVLRSTSGRDEEASVFEETFVLPQEKCNHVPNLASQRGVVQYSYEILKDFRAHLR